MKIFICVKLHLNLIYNNEAATMVYICDILVKWIIYKFKELINICNVELTPFIANKFIL